jgi:hypothetical protein
VLVAEVECVTESEGQLVGSNDCLGDILYQRSGIYVSGCTVKKVSLIRCGGLGS